MTIVPLPGTAMAICDRTDRVMKRNGEHPPWWRIKARDLPDQGILARSLASGIIKPGLTVFLIGGHDRTVFLGADCQKFKIHEYVGLIEGTGWQALVQLGRDVEMVDIPPSSDIIGGQSVRA